jgi:hypothetical protein
MKARVKKIGESEIKGGSEMNLTVNKDIMPPKYNTP